MRAITELNQQNIFDIEYRRNLDRNYLIITNRDVVLDEYSMLMLQENEIDHLLPVDLRIENGDQKLYYDISSLQSLKRVFENKMISGLELTKILLSISRVFDSIREYMLDEEKIILVPEYIFCDMDTLEMKYLFFPAYVEEDSFRHQFSDFSEYLISRINHQDNNAVVLAYQFHRIIKNDNFIIGDIKLLCENQNNIVIKEQEEYELERRKYFPQEDAEILKDRAEFGMSNRNQNERDSEEENKDSSNFLKNNRYKENKDNKDNKKSINDKNEILNKIISKKDNLSKSIIFFGVIFVIGMFLFLGNSKPINDSKKLLEAGMIAFGFAGIIYSIVQNKKKQENDNLICQQDGYEAELLPDSEYNQDFHQMQYKQNYQQEQNNKYQNYSAKENFEYANEISEEQYGKTVFYQCSPEQDERILVEMNRGKEIIHKISHLPYTIGKKSDMVDLIINDASVSRLHAQIYEEEGYLYLTDLGSLNGSFLNGIRIEREERLQLEAGDQINLGKVELLYR